MKRLLICLLCCLLLCTAAFAAEPAITSLKTDCVVTGSGDAEFTQTISIQLDTPVNELQFPLGANARSGSVVGYKASKTTEDGITILTLKSDAGISGSRTFTLRYTLPGLVSAQDGVQTLTLPLLCAKWEFPIENYAFTVTLPEAFPTAPGFSSGYQGDVIEDYMTTSVQENVLSGSTTVSLKDHEALTMTLEAPDGFFSGKHAAWSAGSATTVLIFVCAALGLLYWLFKLRSARLSHAMRPLPPDSAQPGELPYLLCGRGADFNAMVLHWASLGYLTISVSAEGHVLLHRRVDMGNERRRYEAKLMSVLFGESDVCDSASSRYKRAAAAAQGVVPRFWQRRLYRRDSGNPIILIALSCLACALASLASASLLLPDGGWRWLALVLSLPLGGVLARLVHRAFSAAYLDRKIELGAGILAGVLLLLVGRLSGATLPMVVALLLAVFTGWQTVHGGRRSDLGTMLISQTIGFRRFLTRMSDHRVQLQLQNDPQYFYKTLPYAIALGRAPAFVERFAKIELEPCEWFTQADKHPRTGAEFYAALHEMLDTLTLSIRH